MTTKRKLTTMAVLATALTMNAQTYRLVWADEFDNASTLSENWNIETYENMGYQPNKELQYYAADNVSVADGKLVITARKESKGGFSFTSGRLNTRGKHDFLYGKIEASIWFPTGTSQGMWPAFWMMGYDTANWPVNGEIDIFEAGHAGRSENYFAQALHWGTATGQDQLWSVVHDTERQFNDGYHTFTLVWEQNSMKFYMDGALYAEETADRASHFTLASHIIFNFAVGGDITGIYDPNAIGALPYNGAEKKMYVDWVRVYEKTSDSSGSDDNISDNTQAKGKHIYWHHE